MAVRGRSRDIKDRRNCEGRRETLVAMVLGSDRTGMFPLVGARLYYLVHSIEERVWMGILRT